MLIEITTVTTAVLSMSHMGTHGLPTSCLAPTSQGRKELRSLPLHLPTLLPLPRLLTPPCASPSSPGALLTPTHWRHGQGVSSSVQGLLTVLRSRPPSPPCGCPSSHLPHPCCTPFLPWHPNSALKIFQAPPVCPPLLGQSDLRCQSCHMAPRWPCPVALPISTWHGLLLWPVAPPPHRLRADGSPPAAPSKAGLGTFLVTRHTGRINPLPRPALVTSSSALGWPIAALLTSIQVSSLLGQGFLLWPPAQGRACHTPGAQSPAPRLVQTQR